MPTWNSFVFFRYWYKGKELGFPFPLSILYSRSTRSLIPFLTWHLQVPVHFGLCFCTKCFFICLCHPPMSPMNTPKCSVSARHSRKPTGWNKADTAFISKEQCSRYSTSKTTTTCLSIYIFTIFFLTCSSLLFPFLALVYTTLSNYNSSLSTRQQHTPSSTRLVLFHPRD